MGGRGGGSPAGRPAATAAVFENDVRSQQIHIDIVEKPKDGPWRIIGSTPDSFMNGVGLWVTRKNRGSGYDVRSITTDEILASGRSIKEALRSLAKRSGLRVNYVDETAGDKVLGTWG